VTKQLQTLALVFAFALAATAVAGAQEKEKEKPAAAPAATPASARPQPNPTLLKVQIVLGRYQGEKKISTMPYALTMNANNHSSLRMGTRIPIVMLAMSNVPKDAPAGGPIQYQDVGTNIDCNSTALDDGRYLLSISVDDSSVYPDEQGGGSKGNPSFRSFRASNSMVLKNGETGTFTTATDKVTGETVKVDVTLTVVK
jgi:type II secretory pathway component GspD/PulD (secretin)